MPILLSAGLTAGGVIVPATALAQSTTTINDENTSDMPPTDDDPRVTTETKVETQIGTTSTMTSNLSRPYGEDRDLNIRTEVRMENPPATETPPPPRETTVYVEDRDARHPHYGGLGLVAGGGVNEFGNANLRRMTDTGGAWNARLILGTRSPLALEAAYIGTANKIATLGLDNGTLISNGAEGALRLNLLHISLSETGDAMMMPYVLAGFAWKHYNLTGAAVNTSSVQDSDDVFEVPLGGGLAMNVNHFLADARFDYRPALSNDLVRAINDDNNDHSLQTWTVSGRVGLEF